jgi:hypothetical protein
MTKYTLNTTVDNEIITLLGGWDNKSSIVNQILTNALQTEEGITELIEDTKKTLERLEAIRNKIKEKKQKQFDNISEELKKELIGGRYYDKEMKDVTAHQGVKDIIERNPNKLTLWTGIINRKYNTTFNPEQLKDLIKRLKW